MRKLFHTALLGSVFMGLSGAALADTLPLKRVVVTTSGLALYQYDGAVTGDADIKLPVRLDGVDDALKSLVVLDGKGKLGGVALPGREPLAQAFRDLPFSRSDLDSLTQLLSALRGADVRAGDIAGRLMNVAPETQETANGIVTRNRVSILTDAGIKTTLLENLSALQFTDKGVQDQIDRALAALYTNRIHDQRTLTVSLVGEGTRPVQIAYIQAAPLWKSSYRLVLPEGEGKTAVLQGWAVLENTTGQDWNDVGVTLMSGSPVTYKQALYESYYVDRPELPVKVMNRIMPRIDDGTVAMADDESASYERRAGANRNMVGGAMAKSMMAAPPAPAMEMMAMDAAMAPNMAMAGTTMTAAADETASQMVFAFPQPVTLPAGNSLMIPFFSGAVPAEKLWVYQPETDAAHPLVAIALENKSGSGLPPGILTLYDASKNGLLHVGDADMPLIPKGDDRFISFALDTKTNIDRQEQDDRRLGLITVSKGLLHQKAVWRNTTTYTIEAPEDEARTIVIEHPRREGWELLKPEGLASDIENTATHHRLRVAIEAGKTATVTATLERADEEVIALSSIDPGDLEARMEASGKDLPAATRKALEKVRELRAAAYGPQNRLAEIENERQQIFADQERLRENIKTVSNNTAVGKRYLKNLEDQENRLDQLAADEKSAQAALQKANAALSDYIAGLDL